MLVLERTYVSGRDMGDECTCDACLLAVQMIAMQELMDNFSDLFSEVVDTINDSLVEKIGKQLIATLDHIHRYFFRMWLQSYGVPEWLAVWIAVHCPERWLPDFDKLIKRFVGES